jgi:aspartyl protease family protein
VKLTGIRQSVIRIIVALFFALCAASLPADEPIRVSAVALFKDKAALVINGKRRVLKAGKTSPEGVALIKSSSESAVVEIDGEESTLRLDGKIVGKYLRGIPAKTLQLYPGSGGHYFVDGLINGNGVRFLVDTGATAVVINKNAAKRMGILYRVDGSPTRVETASGVETAYRVSFNEVTIRALSLKQVDGIVVDGSFPREALLGQSFLNRLNMRREGQMLELKER